MAEMVFTISERHHLIDTKHVYYIGIIRLILQVGRFKSSWLNVNGDRSCVDDFRIYTHVLPAIEIQLQFVGVCGGSW